MTIERLIVLVKIIRLAAYQLEKEHGINDHIISKSMDEVLASLLKLSKI